eukprot:TRINITY_DN2601_c0_g1_i1.p2 TRINITY_DN2601_c0_g1~~TRINITY_DN2601_c0_g1_i1.p2  ORF type:complete len:55 (-),score=6.34 TRINITY_DN2601_c0_g1_i1:223-387(-)
MPREGNPLAPRDGKILQPLSPRKIAKKFEFLVKSPNDKIYLEKAAANEKKFTFL